MVTGDPEHEGATLRKGGKGVRARAPRCWRVRGKGKSEDFCTIRVACRGRVRWVPRHCASQAAALPEGFRGF